MKKKKTQHLFLVRNTAGEIYFFDPAQFGYPWRGWGKWWKREDRDLEIFEGAQTFNGLLARLGCTAPISGKASYIKKLDAFELDDVTIKPRLHDAKGCLTKTLLKPLKGSEFEKQVLEKI